MRISSSRAWPVLVQLNLCVARACLLLETTDSSLDQIAEVTGFGAAEAMRYHFRKALAVSPVEYRKRFGR